MKGHTHKQPFNDLLSSFIIDENELSTTEANLEKEAEIVFSKSATVSLSAEMAELQISKLTEALTKQTLGTLIDQALATNAAPLPNLQQTTGLTPSLLESIKNDMVFTNSIPVKSLVKLLKLLQVPLERAKAAIAVTFEKLQTESRMFTSMPSNIQPAFKKGVTPGNHQNDFKHLKPDESYLYQNQEALDKYTQRLSELYQQP